MRSRFAAAIAVTALNLALASCGGSPGPRSISKPEMGLGAQGDRESEAYAENGDESVTEEITAAETEAFRWAVRDLSETKDPKRTRYLSLVHLHQQGADPDDVARVAKAVAKVLNSLSWSSSLAAPEPIGEGGLVLKIDLGDYGWTEESWETLVAEHPSVKRATGDLRTLRDESGTGKPLIRADWLVVNAIVPPLYYELLNLPVKLSELEQRLGVDLQADVDGGRVIRAGFDDSGVSTNHRVVERHALKDGYLWRSYEFGTKTGKQDVFANPMGPAKKTASTLPFAGLGGADHAFVADGGEMFFTLPNGLLAFYVADGKGKRLDAVPVDEGQKPITPGASCMGCHSQGPIDKEDKVRDRLGALSADLATKARAMYVPHAEFAAQIAKDGKSFVGALRDLGIDAEEGDPVKQVRKAYLAD